MGVGLPVGTQCKFLNSRPKDNPMNTPVLITYDLHKLGQRYQALRKIVTDNFPTRWSCLESTFIVATTLSPTQVRELLSTALDANDELLVVALIKSSWATMGMTKSCNDWLHANC